MTNLTNKFGSSKSVKIPSGNQSVDNFGQETPKGNNKLGKDFKHQTWYSSFIEKPVEKVQSILTFKKKGLKETEEEYVLITENLEGMRVHMFSMDGGNNEEFLLKEEIGRGSFGIVYGAKRLSDEKEVCTWILNFFLRVN